MSYPSNTLSELTIALEVYRPSTFFRGTLSDGQHSVPFLSSDEHLDEYTFGNGEDQAPAPPYRVLVDSIELRISDCFDPPKVEAFIKAFRSIEKLNESQAAQVVSTVSSLPSIARLLHTYAENKASREHDIEMSSTGSIRSQPSPVHLSGDHDAAVHDVDSSPMSQMRLATQAPMLNASPVIRQPLGELQRTISRQPTSKLMSSDVQRPASKADDSAHNAAEGLIKAAENTIEQVAESSDSDTSVQNLSRTAAVTIIPDKRQLLAEDHPPTCNKPLSNQLEPSLGVTEEEQIHVDMQTKFRRWRAEAAAGRYIPRRACKISKKQLEILVSDERWQPPLPGRDKRPGTIPIELLNELTAQADEATKQPQPVSTAHQSFPDETEVLMRSAPSTIDDLQSSQEVGESQWPLSPQRKAPADPLPPDSPLPSPDSHDQELAHLAASLHEVQSEEGRANDHSSVSSHSSQSWKNKAIHTLTYPQSEPRPIRKPPAKLKSPPIEKSDSRSDTREPMSSSDEPESQVLQKIQVSETPYPGRVRQPDRLARVSEVMPGSRQCPDPSFVPSTYLEATRAKPQDSKKPANPKQQERKANGVGQRIPKRKAVEAEPTVSGKRARVEVVDRKAQKCDPDLEPVLQDIREYRRQALKPLTKDFRRGNPASHSTSGSSDWTTELSDASEQIHGSKALHGAISLPQVSTPLTVPSSRPTSKGGLQGALGTTSASSSIIGIAVPQQLFEKFLATYVDYEGGKVYFDSAVALLRQLRLSRNDPHPSLYDDFVWHQYHSYLSYALTSVENPLSYHSFYNQHIESPSHFAKVITSASLDKLSISKPDCAQKCLSDDASAILRFAEQLNDVGASHSLISSVSLGPAQAGDPLDGQRLVPQGYPEQPDEPLHPSQKSVETWLEGTARAASPDLGTPEDMQPVRSPSVAEMPPPKLSFTQHASPTAPMSHSSAPNSERRKKKKHLSASPFAQTLRTVGKQAAGNKDGELTPFKRWAKAILSLPSERSACAIPQKPTQSVNIFAWR